MILLLKIYIGRAGSGKTSKIFNEIKEAVLSEKENLILSVPEQYSHDAERMLCQFCGDKASLYAQVLSFTRMCSRVFAETGGIADRFIDEAGKILVMSRALELVSEQLKVYGGLSKRSEFISKLVETAKEFRSSKITVDRIIETSFCMDASLKDKLSDIAIIFRVYWGLMNNEVLDPDERLDRLCEKISDAGLFENASVWFDGFDDFTAQQYCVIEEILKKAEDVIVCLNCDGIYSDEPVFEIARNTAKTLIRFAEDNNIPVETVLFENSMQGKAQTLKFLEKTLFSNTDTKFDGVNSEVSAYVCSNMTEECEMAAALAIQLVQNGARWDDIAVAVSDFDAYFAVLGSVFEKYGIPIYSDTKLDILNLPPVLAVISALRIITDGWKYEDVFTYLKTGFANISREDCDVLENYVHMWNIRGAMWYRSEPWTFSQDGYKGEADEKYVERINEIRLRVKKPLVKLRKAISAASVNGDKLTAICEFFDDISLPENIEKYADKFCSNGDYYMAECYMNLGEIIMSALEQFYSVAGDFDTKNEDFVYQLGLLFSKYDVGVIPTSVDNVFVGDISRLRKRDVKHLFVLGMTEGAVPTVTSASGIFSDAERDELISVNFGLSKSSVYRLFGDVNSVYKLLTMPAESLTIMYPLADASGASLNPSYIFENIADMFGLDAVKPKISDYKLWAEKPCREYAAIYSKTEAEAASAGCVFEQDEEFSHLLGAIDEVSSLHRKTLTPESAKKLYGDKITMTASRVDKYKSCKYAYFLQYGLKAKPRMKAEFDASVIGTFVHYILENVTRDIEASCGFKNINDDECIKLTKKYVDLFVTKELGEMQDKTARFKYLFESLCDNTVSVVLNMINELKKSDFRPLDFELDFSDNGDISPYNVTSNDAQLFVRGVVDRVDGWVHDGKLYVRVVDYKTGTKTFNLSDIWYGMGLQMLIYLFALKAMGKERYGMEIVPAGVLYAPAKEVLLSESRHVSDAELEKNRLKNLRRSGLILADDEVIEAMENGDDKIYLPLKKSKEGTYTGDSLATAENLGLLAKHIDEILVDISKEIFNGNVSADPYYRSQVDNSCMYCDYFHACHYSEETDGKYRTLTKLKTPDIWLKLQKGERDE